MNAILGRVITPIFQPHVPNAGRTGHFSSWLYPIRTLTALLSTVEMKCTKVLACISPNTLHERFECGNNEATLRLRWTGKLENFSVAYHSENWNYISNEY